MQCGTNTEVYMIYIVWFALTSASAVLALLIDPVAVRASSVTLAKWVTIGCGLVVLAFGWLEITASFPADWPQWGLLLSLFVFAGGPQIFIAYERDRREKIAELLRKMGGMNDAP
jgi:hypothetical protein